MPWYRHILHPDYDFVWEIHLRNLIRALRQRSDSLFLEGKSRFVIFWEEAPGNEKHYYFSPEIVELAGDILREYDIGTLVSPPKSIKNMRQIVL
jgi:hypothetical protein